MYNHFIIYNFIILKLKNHWEQSYYQFDLFYNQIGSIHSSRYKTKLDILIFHYMLILSLNQIKKLI